MKINLRDYYPFYTFDCFVDVPDEVASLLLAHARYEAAYQRRTYRNRAHFSLDRSDGIEHDILYVTLSPCEIYERKVASEQLYTAIASLPDKQAKRIYARFFLGLNIGEIARLEGVSLASISGSITRRLTTLEKYLKNSL